MPKLGSFKILKAELPKLKSEILLPEKKIKKKKKIVKVP